MTVRVRAEIPEDAAAIARVTQAAFAVAEHADGTEQFIVAALRDAGALAVSLVAEADGLIVGHVAVSPVAVDGVACGWLGLGPVSVMPGRHGRGIGTALIEAALDRLRRRGAAGCVVLGEPAYYGRFGFRADLRLSLPEVPPDYFLALAISDSPPAGVVSFHEAFDTVPPDGIIRLRPASGDDLDLLRRWDEQPHVIASDPDSDWQWASELPRNPPWRDQLIAELDRAPIGFVQVIDPAREDSHYWGDVPPNLRAVDIWIGEADQLGRGHGTRIMNQVLARCFADPAVDAVLIDPLAGNIRAHRFYRRLGFEFVEKRYFGHDHCAVHRLDRARFERAVGGTLRVDSDGALR